MPREFPVQDYTGRKIAAEYAKARRDGFDSPDAEGIAELGEKMEKMASVVWNPICPVCLGVC